MHELPAARDVLPLLGGLSLPTGEVTTLVHRATERMRTYTRGAGFTPEGVEPDLAAILVASVVRAILNPESALSSAPPFTGSPGCFGDWTNAELRVIQDYAGRAQSGDQLGRPPLASLQVPATSRSMAARTQPGDSCQTK